MDASPCKYQKNEISFSYADLYVYYCRVFIKYRAVGDYKLWEFFGEIKEELAATDAYYFLPDIFYTDEVEAFLDSNQHILKSQTTDTILHIMK